MSLCALTSLGCQVSLLEWTDDLEVFLLKGYGSSINYHMGIPLLKDTLQSIEQAIVAKEGIILFRKLKIAGLLIE